MSVSRSWARRKYVGEMTPLIPGLRTISFARCGASWRVSLDTKVEPTEMDVVPHAVALQATGQKAASFDTFEVSPVCSVYAALHSADIKRLEQLLVLNNFD